MKRWLWAVLLLCLLSGCAGEPAASWAEVYDSGSGALATIAYIPLDDRPVNTTRVELLAKSAGFRLLMPEKDLYRTALDGLPLNSNGTQYGDGDALLQWLENTRADYYVISLDQILSGGLVNSRWLTELTDEQEKLNRLLQALEGKTAILFDTVMRLAPTVGYGGCTLAEYEALREYGRQPRTILAGKLTPDWIAANYPVDTELEEAPVQAYLSARSRKLQLTGWLLSAAAEQANIRLYYGVDDSSPENTVQTNEIAFIRQNLKNGQLFAGTDELGLVSVTRVIREHFGASPRVNVRCFGIDPQAPADEYDMGSLQENILSHLDALGAAYSREVYDLELLVMGRGDPEKLLARYRENTQKGIPTMVVDLSGGSRLPEALLQEASEFLLSYSAWNTAGNAVGIALSNGIGRYLYLKWAEAPVAGANAGFVEGLTLSFVKDVAYARVREQMDPFCRTGESGEALALLRSQAQALENLEGKGFLTSLDPAQRAPVPSIAITGLWFPWCRSFEAELEFQIG